MNDLTKEELINLVELKNKEIGSLLRELDHIKSKIPDLKSLIHSITKNSTKEDRMFSERYEEEIFAFLNSITLSQEGNPRTEDEK